jgi:hypothetical protein
MLSRAIAIALAVLVSTACVTTAQPKRDYLVRGEEKPSDAFARKHRRAVREICERAYRRDVVLRTVDLAPFGPEWACGLTRGRSGYRAFFTGASTNLSYALYYGLRRDGSKAGDYHTLKQPMYERPISDSLAARIAALWRRVLFAPRNYGKAPHMYLDTDKFTFHLAFFLGEQITARMQSYGPQVEQLIDVDDALGVYADGTITEQKLAEAVAKAERKLGI